MHCPKCNAEMDAIDVRGIEVDRCTACDGLWFDLREVDRLVAQRDAEAIDAGDRSVGAYHDRVPASECPRCAATLIRMVVRGEPLIHYEACSVCGGAYFDAGEFTALRRRRLRRGEIKTI